VSLRAGAELAHARLAARLEEAIGRRVQVVSLGAAEAEPLLLADVLREGRVLVDRDGEWGRLRRREAAIRQAAARREQELDALAWETLERLGDPA
jgi:hypothetical protein